MTAPTYSENESMFPAFLSSPASTLKRVHDFQNAHGKEAGQTTARLPRQPPLDANREASPVSRPTTTTPLPSDTKVLSIGLHPSAPDYSRMLDGFDNEAILIARIEAGIAALREAGFDAVPCLIDTSPDRAEAAVRELLQEHAFARDPAVLQHFAGEHRRGVETVDPDVGVPALASVLDGSTPPTGESSVEWAHRARILPNRRTRTTVDESGARATVTLAARRHSHWLRARPQTARRSSLYCGGRYGSACP
ncbi:hypothetical protein JHN63_08675 [Streptomyces sp. MBT65]|uniref:hypothetical protein n=1 Tax=Streptomyces sp. MBT65 TaxID=1488395 RepID=UPI00190C1DCB|nr:hypothetical protein [Streptomyces sp. MBT65]MBK3573891.1 hypothetical protein [Streptomyces sp. MBT65]